MDTTQVLGVEAMGDGVKDWEGGQMGAGEDPSTGEAGNWMGGPEMTQEVAWSPRPGSRPQHRRCCSRTAARSRRGRSSRLSRLSAGTRETSPSAPEKEGRKSKLAVKTTVQNSCTGQWTGPNQMCMYLAETAHTSTNCFLTGSLSFWQVSGTRFGPPAGSVVAGITVAATVPYWSLRA